MASLWQEIGVNNHELAQNGKQSKYLIGQVMDYEDEKVMVVDTVTFPYGSRYLIVNNESNMLWVNENQVSPHED